MEAAMQVAAAVKRILLRGVPAILALALALPAVAEEPGVPDAATGLATDLGTDLEPMTVTAPANPLDRSLHLLRLLVDKSAPCLGCDAVLARREPFPATVLEYLLLPADRIDEATRTARDIKLQDSRDLEYLRP
jgi:hypothetical protein